MNDKLPGERELIPVKIRALGHARLMHEADTQKELLCFYPQDFEAAVMEVLCRAALASDAEPQAPKGPAKLGTTDAAREFLNTWMLSNFPSDITFSSYIREDLAGDFAWQLANALAQPQALKVPDAKDAASDSMRACLVMAHSCIDRYLKSRNIQALLYDIGVLKNSIENVLSAKREGK